MCNYTTKMEVDHFKQQNAFCSHPVFYLLGEHFYRWIQLHCGEGNLSWIVSRYQRPAMELVAPFMNLVSMVMFKCATRNIHKRYWMHASGTLCTYSPLTFPVILSKWDSFSYIAAKQSRDQTSHWLPHHGLHTRKCLEIQIHVHPTSKTMPFPQTTSWKLFLCSDVSQQLCF